MRDLKRMTQADCCRKADILQEGLKKAPKGSYTVEAAYIIPMFLFIMAAVMNIGIDLYSETKAASEQEAQADFDAVSYFYTVQTGETILDNVKNYLESE